MSTHVEYAMDKDNLENFADRIKVMVVRSLVVSGYLDEDEGDQWAEIHTFVARKKSVFQTITDKWRREKEEGGLMWTLVSSRVVKREVTSDP